jgi:arylsulfatase A-like enzyme
MQQTKRGPLGHVAAALIGFLAADLVIVVIQAPALIKPANWIGLISLTLSAATMYLFVGVYMLLFYLILKAINAIFRLKFDSGGLAVLTVALSILFLIVQEKLQTLMLARSVAPNDPYFYLPTALGIALVCVVMVIMRIIRVGRFAIPTFVSRALVWPGLIVTSFIIFMFYASTYTMLNVLAVYSDDEQRDHIKENAPPKNVVAANDAPNFIVIAIEAFRSDEFTQENVPFLWELAQKNTWLKKYHVVASATRPSVTSFFTSLYPAQHGAYNLAINQALPGVLPTTTKVSPNIKALPSLLQDNGYRTIMVTSNRLASDRVFGFEKVFIRFDSVEPLRFRILEPEPFLGYFILRDKLKFWKIFKMMLFTPGHSRIYFDAGRLNRTVLEQFGDDDGRPFLFYVHYIEPHTPYYSHPYPAIQFNPITREGMYEKYRMELTEIDRSVANVYGVLEEKGLLDNTWILITSDHGEEFYDHGNWGHGKSLYPEVIRVPAILVAPRNRSNDLAAGKVQTTVENIDIAPTFAALAGVPSPDYWEGESLIPLLSDSGNAITDTALGQFNDGRYLWSTAIDSDWQMIFREPANALDLELAERRAQRKVTMFNVTDDPLAQRDLYKLEPERAEHLVKTLEEALFRLETSAVLFQSDEVAVNDENLEQLRALGYLD